VKVCDNTCIFSSSKKGLGISNISNKLDSDKFVVKLSDYNGELLNTGISSGTNFDDHKDVL
jgi:hypothetical protein